MKYAELWWSDLLAKTAHLSAEEFGVYLRVLAPMYIRESALEDDVEKLERLANVHGARERAALGRILADPALNWIRADGTLTQKRAAEEIAKRRAYVAQQTELSHRRWSKPETGEIRPPVSRGNGADHAPAPQPVESIPLKDGTEFQVTPAFAADLERLYPRFDVPGTLRQIRGWAIGKLQSGAQADLWTRRGAGTGITSWFAREEAKYAETDPAG